MNATVSPRTSDSPRPRPPRHAARRLVAIGGLLGGLLAWCGNVPVATSADPARLTITDLQVGLKGKYRLGHWTPVTVTVDNDGAATGSVHLIAPDGDDLPTSVSRYSDRDDSTEIIADGKSRLRLYAKIGREPHSLTCTFQQEGTGHRVTRTFHGGRNAEPASFVEPLAPETKLWVTLGAPLSVPLVGTQNDAVQQVHLDDPAELPDQWFGYDGVDAVLITTSDPAWFESLKSDDPRLAALDRWVRLGGRLILCVGAHGESLLGGEGPLTRFVPGKFAAGETLNRAAALEGFALSQTQIPATGRGNQLGMPVTRLAGVQGKKIVREGELPLVIEASHGFGTVVFAAFDLDRPPLSNWTGRDTILLRLMLGRLGQVDSPEQITASLEPQTSRGDLVSQLRGALDEFPGVRVVSFWTVGGLIFVYLLLIGPGDYFFLRRVLRRMALTWVTFPTIVVLVSAGAYYLATTSKGDQLRINQVDVIDVDTISHLTRGTTWTNVFSPETAAYDLSLAPSSDSASPWAAEKLLFSWLGQPGGGWGGMDKPAGGDFGLAPQPYRFSAALDKLYHVPIDIWTTKSFVGRWQGQAQPDTIPSQLRTSFHRTLRGTLTSGLDFPLSECLLASDRWAYPIGDLAPGQTVDVRDIKYQDLESVLKDYHVVENKSNQSLLQRATPYDATVYDLPRDLRLAMFFEEVSARNYTGFDNHSEAYLDMSRQLTLGRAVLLGRAPRGLATRLQRDDKPLVGADDRHWVYFRFVLPVEDTDTP